MKHGDGGNDVVTHNRQSIHIKSRIGALGQHDINVVSRLIGCVLFAVGGFKLSQEGNVQIES